MNRRFTALVIAASVLGGAVVGGGAAIAAPMLAGTASPSDSHGSSGITMEIQNNSGEDLTLVSADNPYGHWQDRAPQTIAAGETNVTVSEYSSNVNGAELDLVYALPDGEQVHLSASVPNRIGGNNTDTSTDTVDGFTLDHYISGGYHATATYNLRPTN